MPRWKKRELSCDRSLTMTLWLKSLCKRWHALLRPRLMSALAGHRPKAQLGGDSRQQTGSYKALRSFAMLCWTYWNAVECLDLSFSVPQRNRLRHFSKRHFWRDSKSSERLRSVAKRKHGEEIIFSTGREDEKPALQRSISRFNVALCNSASSGRGCMSCSQSNEEESNIEGKGSYISCLEPSCACFGQVSNLGKFDLGRFVRILVGVPWRPRAAEWTASCLWPRVPRVSTLHRQCSKASAE